MFLYVLIFSYLQKNATDTRNGMPTVLCIMNNSGEIQIEDAPAQAGILVTVYYCLLWSRLAPCP